MHVLCGDRHCDLSGNPVISDGGTRVSAEVRRRWLWGGLGGTLTAFSKRRIIFQEEIARLREETTRLQQSINEARAKLGNLNAHIQARSQEEQEFNALMKFAADQRRQLQTDFIPLEEISESKEEWDLLAVYLDLLSLAINHVDVGHIFTRYCELRGISDLTAIKKNDSTTGNDDMMLD
jgi:seryl-tRNA synthetase